jgi:integrase
MESNILVHDYERRIERMTDRIGILDDITPANKKAILDFKAEAIAQGYSKARIAKYLEILTILGRQMEKDFDKATREDIMQLVTQIEMRNFSEWTKCTYKTILKVFYKRLKGEIDYPDEVRWIKTRHRNLNTKLPEELLTEEEIKSMVEYASHPRDKALIAVMADGGLRIGEVLSRRIKHVSFDEHGAVLTVDGKTGMRRVRLIYSVPNLATWINLHPFKSNAEAPLWIEIRKTREPLLMGMSYGSANNLIKRIACKAGIRKRVYSHLFRHSRATALASHLTEAQMNHHFGWIQGSRMTATYVHMSGRDVDDALLKMTGVKEGLKEEKKKTMIPLRCPRCNQINSETARFCEKCWLPLDIKTAIDFERELESRGNLVKEFLQDPEVQSLFKQKMVGMFSKNALRTLDKPNVLDIENQAVRC